MYLKKKFDEPVRMRSLKRGWFSSQWQELDGALRVQEGGAVALVHGDAAFKLSSPVKKGGLEVYVHYNDLSKEHPFISDVHYPVKGFTVEADGIMFEV